MNDRQPRRTAVGTWARALRRACKGDLGAAIAQVALLGSALVMVTGVIVVRSVNSYQATQTDRGWEEALHVAESGTDDILAEMDQDPDYVEDNDLVVAAGTPLDTRDEIVTAAEKLADDKPHALIAVPEGEVVVFQKEGEEVLLAVGFSPSKDAVDRTERVVKTEFIYEYGGTHSFPAAAMVAGGNVTVTGNGKTKTQPSPPHEASIYTNGSFNGNGNAEVDGDITAVGSATGGTAAGEITQGAEPVELPEPEALTVWRDGLIAEAQASGMRGPISSSAVVNASIYVNGDIMLGSGDTLVINGPGVVFVKGSILMSGQSRIVNNGAILASDGPIHMSGQASYEVGSNPSAAAIVTFSDSPEALVLTGGASGSAQGIAYAPNGGAMLAGNGTYVGAILAGGEVNMVGNGTLIYPEGLLDGAAGLPPTRDGVELQGKKEFTITDTNEGP